MGKFVVALDAKRFEEVWIGADQEVEVIFEC